MKFFTDAKLRAGTVWREFKEKQEEKKAQKQATAALNSEHGHGRFFLLTVPATATIFAAIVEVYWAFLFCIEATGHVLLDWSTSVGSNVAASGDWHFAFTINSVMVLIGLACATVPIVMISMVWLPVQFTMRGTGRWRRGTMIFCGLLANLLVIISGTVVMNGNRQEQVREAVVTEQTAAQGRAAIDARLAFEQEQLRLALNNSNPYLNQAANVGAEEWERSYVAQARNSNDPRLPMLERALGAARAADARRANIERLTIERATAAPEAATASNVEDTVGRDLNAFAQAVEVWRPPFVALICTLVGIFGAWWTLAIMQGLNPRDVLRSGWADDAHRIEDLRDQEPIAKNPAKMQTQMRATNAETGEEEILIQPKPYWRAAKRGQKTRIDVPAESQPDETGFPDKSRTAVTLGGEMELLPEVEPTPEVPPVDASPGITGDEDHADNVVDAERHDADHLPAASDAEVQPDLPEELLELNLTDEAQNETEQTEQEDTIQEHNAEPDQEREPETREDRLLPASFAAE